MERYNYMEAMKDDIMQYIKYDLDSAHYDDSREELEEFLNDELWTCDGVTGNASGSYFFNAWKAEEAIAHNLDLLSEALQEFDCNCNVLEKGAEWCDVTIRCYLLGQAINAVLDELEENNEFFAEED